MYIMASLIVSGIFSVLPPEVFANQIIDERNPLIHNVGSVFDSSNATSTASSNNTIILNAAEVGEDETAEEGEDETAEEGEDETAEEGEDETYRWVDSTGEENPNLNTISNTEYTIKIDNPTDEEHELIIDSGSGGNTSAIAESGDIEPGKNVEFKFKADQVGELGYHCKYHPDMMNGTINVS
jgi:plastocyanin